MEATEGDLDVSHEDPSSADPSSDDGAPEERGPSWTSADTFAMSAITAAAAVLRLVRLDDPKVLVFDETYYAKDACWYVTSSESLCKVDIEATLVHPPLAKWLIGIGIKVFGYDSFGWRISAAIAGTLTVLLLYLLARRLLRSTVAASLTAGFLAIDLLHFVESRIAMLDIFVPLFGLASVLFIVYDRDRPPDEPRTPTLWRPWRIGAGLAAGAAVASKWSGGFFIFLVVVLCIAWAITGRRRRDEEHPVRNTLRREGASIVISLLIVPALVYSFTYLGRLPVAEPEELCPQRTGAWVNRLVQQQKCMLDFHKNLESTHAYQSPAWSWLALKRPVSYYFETDPNGDYKEVFATGSPFVWWTSVLALGVVAVAWIRRRGRERGPEGVILAGFVFTYGPWLVSGLLSDRSAVFIFYLLPTLPFMCLALGYVASRLGSSWEAKAALGLFSAAAIWFFVFYYPLLTKIPLPQPQWDKRIWIFDNCDKPSGDPTTSLVTETVGGRTTTRTTFTTGTNEDLPPKGWCWI